MRILSKKSKTKNISSLGPRQRLFRRRKVTIFIAIAVIFIAICTSFIYKKMLVARVFASANSINVIENGNTISVNTGSGLIYTIDKENGDMISCKLNGTELNGKTKHSQVEMGLGKSKVTYNKSESGSTVTIAAETSTLTHYYISREGENIIYMATYITAEPSIGEMRYIFRGNGNILTNVTPNSNNSDSIGLVEHKEVYGHQDGATTSKYYDNDQAKDLTIRGDIGKGVGVFMAYGNRETSSGGPFFRDIQFQSGGDSEIYNYMNSGHEQTEPFRMGLHGPYALVFTNGSKPNIPDFSWMSNLGLKGWVSERGSVVLNGLSGMDPKYTYTIGFANSTAQYWATASVSGHAESKNMIPGTYTMTVYKGELGVYTQSVNVTAEKTTTIDTCNISADPSKTPVIWRIGDWDGTPLEFLNGNNLSKMHPSDARNSSFKINTFVAGSPANEFPALQLRKVNSPTTITFNLSKEQAESKHTLKIGITAAYNGGRPSVEVNGKELSKPDATTQPKSRSITIGTYRGNNNTFTWDIPASNFVVGKNTLTIASFSGTEDLTHWLSAGWEYDCVELDS